MAKSKAMVSIPVALVVFNLVLFSNPSSSRADSDLGSVRVVFQTNYGDIEFGFLPDVAPKTVDHIFKLVRLGCYNTNHFFRVDKGFVAQVAAVVGNRLVALNEDQRQEAEKTVVGEFSSIKHVRGILSMGRLSDPNSGTSSFSILLGNAPHLDGQYAIFGRLTKGDDTLKKFEELPTRKEGMFVMPTERVTILSTYYYDTKLEACEHEKFVLKRRLYQSNIEIEKQATMTCSKKSDAPANQGQGKLKHNLSGRVQCTVRIRVSGNPTRGARISCNDSVGISAAKTMQSFVVEVGSHDKLTFNDRDLRNVVNEVRKLKIKPGDAQAL